MHGTLTIARLTWLEARRRRIMLAAVLGGLAFLIVFGLGAHFVFDQLEGGGAADALARQLQMQILTIAGLYVVNFLGIAAAILLPVDTVSGEIGTGVMQTLASKPVRRSEIIVGKWLAHAAMTTLYVALLVGGIALIMRVETGFVQSNLGIALPLMCLAALVMTTVTITGGVKLTTVTNGMFAFALYGIAFIGGWVEQVGAVTGSETARRIGTAISLVSPADAMWRRAAYDLQPPFMRELQFVSPFGSASLPSAAMVWWTAAFVVVVLGAGVVMFRKRTL